VRLIDYVNFGLLVFILFFLFLLDADYQLINNAVTEIAINQLLKSVPDEATPEQKETPQGYILKGTPKLDI
jgi:hypothetical protein